MQEIMTLMIFIVCFLGVWVTKLSRKVTQLEYEIAATQMQFEKEHRDVLLILQKDADAHSVAYTALTDLVSKQVVKNMETVGELESKFNDLRRYVVNIVYVNKEGKEKK